MKKLDATLAEKLGLTPEAKPDEIAKALGGFKYFESKDDLNEWVKSQIDNVTKKHSLELDEIKKAKTTEIETLNKKWEEKLGTKDKYLQGILGGLWKKNLIKGDIPFDKLDLSKIDTANIEKQLVKFAVDNNISIEVNNSGLKTPIKPIEKNPNLTQVGSVIA